MPFLTAEPPIKFEIVETFHKEQQYFFGDTLKSEHLNFYDNLVKSLVDENISPDVFNNALKIYNALPTYVSTNISINDIYNSNVGTIIMDFEIDFDNVFSLEVGKSEIGYFSEINSQTVSFCRNTSIDETSIRKLNSELENFYMNYEE